MRRQRRRELRPPIGSTELPSIQRLDTWILPAAGARVAASVLGPDAGVAAVCAVAGVVPALQRGEGGAGAVGEWQQRVHVGVRGIGGVSGAGDGPDGGEPPAGDIVGDGGQHRGTGCGAAAGRGSVRQAETNRRR